MKILVTGATGLIGRELVHRLLVEGHEVRALARSPQNLPELSEQNVFSWSDEKIPPAEALNGCDAVIHLAGEGIVDRRWTEHRKKRLWDSRISGSKNLVSALYTMNPVLRPKVFISSSAIGYYENSNSPQDESSALGSGFLAELCAEWENSVNEANKLGTRTVLLRTGLVLAKGGGLLKKSGPIVLGNGQQWMSWIHIEDIVRFILLSLESEAIRGPYNMTAPTPVTNLAFTKTFAKIAGFPFTISAPAVALKLALGEMSQVVLASQRILPNNAISAGFQFKFSNLEGALRDLMDPFSIIDNRFSTKQFIPLSRKEVFPFFGSAENLEILTPPWLHFQIEKSSTPTVEKGTLIYYKIKIHKIPVKWKTIIKEWNPETSFVDNQLKGPYQKWHHLHTFEDVLGGTLISDEVTYRIPGWIFGKLLLPLIRKDILEIFRYRQQKIKELYKTGSLKSL